MNIFITGASGFIGGSLATRLVAKGHTVRGLVRGHDKADRLRALGIQPVLGSLDDAALVQAEAARSDGVINAASSDHRSAVQAILAGLKGSGKPFLHTSGSSVIGDDVQGNILSERVFDEDTPLYVEPGKQARHAIDRMILDAAQDGVRSVVLCNTMIYGTGSGLHAHSVQLPPLVEQAQDSGIVKVVGKGVNRWSNVHIEDVVDLYMLALKNAPAGSFYFVENGEASFAELGAAIAQRLGLGPIQSLPLDEAIRIWGEGHARYSFGSNSRVRSIRARRELGWAPKHASVTDWILHDMPLDD
jgi:nucleoside-diphosphate-sugar epimerase